MDTQYEFHIEAKSLGEALDDFVEQTGLMVLFPKWLADVECMKPVIGSFSVSDALDRLFAGTSFSGGLTKSGAIFIVPETTVREEKMAKTKRKRGLLGLLSSVSAAVLGSATAVSAQDEGNADSVDEIVVVGRSFRSAADATATKLSTPIEETAASIAIIDESLFNDIGVTSFAEITQYIPGVTNFAPNYGQEFSFVARGFGINNQNAIKVNGAPTGTFVIFDELAVDRTEFVKGSNAVTYGEVSAGGFLNLALKKAPSELEINGQIRMGTDNFVRGEATAGGPLTASGNVRGFVGYAQLSSDQFFEFGDQRREAVYGTLSADLTDRLTVDFFTTWDSNQGVKAFGAPAGVDNTDPDNPVFGLAEYDEDRLPSLPGSTQGAENLFLQFIGTYDLTDNIQVVANYSRFRAEISDESYEGFGEGSDDFPFVDLTPGSPTFGDFTLFPFAFDENITSEYAELRLQGEEQFSDDIAVSFYLSGEYRNFESEFDEFIVPNADGDDDVVIFNLFNPDRTVAPRFSEKIFDSAGRFENEIFSVSAVTSFDFYHKLRVNLGIRYDSRDGTDGFDTFENNDISYSASAVYSLTDSTNVYYAYGESTEYLSALNCDGRGLEPETGRSHEIGVKWEVNESLLATAVYFDNESTNAPVLDFCSVGQALFPGQGTVNGDGIQFGEGVELELIGNITPNWNIIAGYAYVDDGRDDGTPIPTPENTFTLFTIYDIVDGPLSGFGIGGGVRFATDRALETFEEPGFEGFGEQGDYTLIDVALYYRLNDNINFAVNGTNLFNEEWYSGFGTAVCCNVRQADRAVIFSANFNY